MISADFSVMPRAVSIDVQAYGALRGLGEPFYAHVLDPASHALVQRLAVL